MSMKTTALHIKIEADLKREAQKTAQELGLTLSAVVKVLLREFIRTKHLSIGLSGLREISNARTRRHVK